MKNEVVGGVAGTILSATGTAIQTNEILQTVSLIITIIGGLLTITMAILTWWNKAKKDGKIDKDEINELVDIVKDGSTEIKDAIKEGKNGEDSNKH